MNKDSSALAEARGERTQAQIADELEVTQATVSHWENCLAAPHPELWERIADVYGISFTKLARHFSHVRRSA